MDRARPGAVAGASGNGGNLLPHAGAIAPCDADDYARARIPRMRRRSCAA